MNQAARFLRLLMPILSAAYGIAIIYVTALPLSGDYPGFGCELLTWLITLAGITLSLYLVHRVEPKVFPSARVFSLKLPPMYVFVGLLLIAPLWLVTEEYLVYGMTSLFHTVELEPLIYTTDELRKDLLSSVHAVLLAPILEELCFRQMAISPFRRRRAQIVVCVVMPFCSEYSTCVTFPAPSSARWFTAWYLSGQEVSGAVSRSMPEETSPQLFLPFTAGCNLATCG